MFNNTSENGNLAYFLGRDKTGALLVVMDRLRWSDTGKIASLLNAEEVAGMPVTLDDGREFFVTFDAKVESPKEVLIFKYVSDNDQKNLVDIAESDNIIVSILINEYMKLNINGKISFCNPNAFIETTLKDPVFLKAYDALDDRAHKEFFRGGRRDAAAICKSFQYILNNRDCKYIFDLYIFICCRIFMGMSAARIEQSFNLGYREIEKVTRLKLITFVNLHFNDINLNCMDDISIRIVDNEIKRIAAHSALIKKLSDQNADTFGLSADNPILTMSIPKAYSYLERLIPDLGYVSNIRRIGVADSIFPDIVDIYEIEVTFDDEKLITTMFIDSYADFDSTKAPKKFALKEATLDDAIRSFAHNKIAFEEFHPLSNKTS